MLIEKSNDWYGTSLMGYIEPTTRQQLEAVFGSPVEYGDGDKVTTEWTLSIDGTTATIYDWKRYEQGAPRIDEPYKWHIGGRSKDAVRLVELALKRRGK